MGSEDLLCQFSIEAELCKLPYGTCWFEWHNDNFFIDLPGRTLGGVLAIEDAAIPGAMVLLVFLRDPTRCWYLKGLVFAWPGDGKMHTLISPTKDGDIGHNFAAHARGPVFSFLSAMNCCNVERIEEKAPPKLNTARAKRSKMPLFSTWTLNINLAHPGSSSSKSNGTHASPRVHLRRGHVRRYQSGLWVWVQPCVVGNKALGLIHKDYAVTKSDEPETVTT